MFIKCSLVNEGIKMETEYRINRWLRALDIVGMVIATISFPGVFFLRSVQNFQISNSNGISYNINILTFWLAIFLLICCGFFFGKGLKGYVCHQVTRDDVKVLRIISAGFILGSLILYFISRSSV